MRLVEELLAQHAFVDQSQQTEMARGVLTGSASHCGRVHGDLNDAVDGGDAGDGGHARTAFNERV